MPKKLTKALRGKRRWIGCTCEGFDSRRDLANFVNNIPVKLFDFENNMCIFEVKLEDYNKVKSILPKSIIGSTEILNDSKTLLPFEIFP